MGLGCESGMLDCRRDDLDGLILPLYYWERAR